jgi:hypothetical protein
VWEEADKHAFEMGKQWIDRGWPGNLDFLYHSQPRSVASRARCSLSQKATFNYQPSSRHVGICIRSQERGHASWASVLTSSLSGGNRDANTAQLTTAEDPRMRHFTLLFAGC